MKTSKLLILFSIIVLSKSLYSQKPQVVITTGHASIIQKVAVSPNGKFVASNTVSHIIKIWDINSGKEICSLNNKDGKQDNEERIMALDFFEKGNRLLTIDKNGKIKIWDIKTETAIHTFYAGVGMPKHSVDISKNRIIFLNTDYSLVIADLDKLPARIYTDIKARAIRVNPANNNEVFIVDLKNNFFLYDIEKKNKTVIFEKPDNYLFHAEISENGKHLAIIIDKKVKIWSMKTGKLLKTLENLKPTSIAFNHKNNDLAILHNNETTNKNEIKILSNNLKEKRVMKKIALMATFIYISHNGKYLAVNSMLMVGNSVTYTIDLIDWKTEKKVKTLKSRVHGIWQLVASKNTPRIAALSIDLNLRIWNIAEQSIEKIFPFTRKIAINNDGNILAMQTFSEKAPNYTAVIIWDLDTMRYISELHISEMLTDMKICADNKHLIVSNIMGEISLWNIESGKKVNTIKTSNVGNQVVDISSDLQYIVAGSSGRGGVTIYDIKNNTDFKLVNSHLNVGASTVRFSANSKYVVSGSYDADVHIWETTNWTEVHDLSDNTCSVSSVVFSKDDKLFASATEGSAVKISDYGINVWNTETGEFICKLLGHNQAVKGVAFSGKQNMLYSGSVDGMIKIWDLDSCKEIATCIAIDYEDYIFMTPDYYYTGSPNALKGVGFKIDGTKLYPFEQFDLRLNRPDIIAERINLASTELIDAFRRAYIKRLEKMGYNESMFNNDFNIPEVEIINKNEFDFKINKNKISLNIAANDEKYEIDRVNVWINNIPIYGRDGLSFKSENLNSINKKIYLDLNEGRNVIQVSVLNNKGVESLKETIEVLAPITNKKHDLYIISIGVSQYADNSMNLKYAAKDANDVGVLFKDESKIFENVHIIPILDTNATKENIFATRSILEDTKIDDMVIIFFAGHGMLSYDYNYYFATTDIDVYKPEERGFGYEELEELVDNIPARRKIIFVDACHSGEIDIDEYNNVMVEIDDNVYSRGVNSTRSSYSKIGLNNSFSLMKELFSDLRRGTGAVIISSAGGAEYAYESNKLQNGIFTYVLINGIKTMEADANNDKEISVVELKNYVIFQVGKITKGRQNPTVRRENVEFNFNVW